MQRLLSILQHLGLKQAQVALQSADGSVQREQIDSSTNGHTCSDPAPPDDLGFANAPTPLELEREKDYELVKLEPPELPSHCTDIASGDLVNAMPEGEEKYLEGGWTRVGKGKGCKPEYHWGIPTVIRDYTVKNIQADYDYKRRIWRASSARKQLHRVLDQHRPDEGWNIETAICLATNSFSRDNWENRKRAMYQFVAFMDIVEHLRESSVTAIKIFAQDPHYTLLDNEYLRTHGIEITDAWANQSWFTAPIRDYIGPQTFLFEPFMEINPAYAEDLLTKNIRLLVSSPNPRPGAEK